MPPGGGREKARSSARAGPRQRQGAPEKRPPGQPSSAPSRKSPGRVVVAASGGGGGPGAAGRQPGGSADAARNRLGRGQWAAARRSGGGQYAARRQPEEAAGRRHYACTALVLRAQISSQELARGPRGYFFVLRLYYACTTGANFKPGAGKRTPRELFCTTLVLHLYYGSKFQARSRQEDPEGTLLYYACTALVRRAQI